MHMDETIGHFLNTYFPLFVNCMNVCFRACTVKTMPKLRRWWWSCGEVDEWKSVHAFDWVSYTLQLVVGIVFFLLSRCRRPCAAQSPTFVLLRCPPSERQLSTGR